MNTEIDSVNRSMFRRYIREASGGKPIGRDGRIRVTYFLDLMSAAHNRTDLELMADTAAKFIDKTIGSISYDAIVGPKRGNVLFAKAVADRLGKNSGLIRDEVLFGRWLEGNLHSGQKVVVVDDIAADGEMLCDAVDKLRLTGLHVVSVFVLVDRNEGDAAAQLKELDTSFYSGFQLDDRILSILIN